MPIYIYAGLTPCQASASSTGTRVDVVRIGKILPLAPPHRFAQYCAMAKPIKFACAVFLLASTAVARAELVLDAGVEYFDWQEDTTPSVQETGPMFAGGITLTQDKEQGFLVGYRGQIWGGQVTYNGAELFTGAPLTGTTQYTGLLNEGQLRYRVALRHDQRLDGVLGVGADLWRRQLSADQKEDWAVGYARLGVEITPQPGRPGWIGGAGVKYPFYTYENANLTDIGFDQNPTFTPGKDWSAYANVGYRIDAHWSLVGYYDSYRFSQSQTV